MMRSLFPMTLLCALGLFGCQQGGDGPAQARAAELENAAGIKILISGAGELGPDQVHAISQSVEGKAQDVGAAMVRLKKEDGEAEATIEIELWGNGLPESAALVSQLKGDFAELADAQISVVNLEPGTGPKPLAVEVDEEATPEEAKHQIIEALKADGVEGEIDVQVEDDENGRRVEVKVEKHEDIEE
ncbi:MAG: hypothetical protein KC486_16740 [Myxococcales bacterium]|nr:hypothetical protein [Myxococcales bacterium]